MLSRCLVSCAVRCDSTLEVGGRIANAGTVTSALPPIQPALPGNQMLPEGGRVLVVRLSALGDVLFALETVAALHRERPDVTIDFLVEDRFQKLLANHPQINRVIVYPRQNRLRIPGSLLTLRRQRYDVALDVHGIQKSAMHMLFVRARHKVGPAAPASREGATYSYNLTVPMPTPPPTPVVRACSVLDFSGQAAGEPGFGCMGRYFLQEHSSLLYEELAGITRNQSASPSSKRPIYVHPNHYGTCGLHFGPVYLYYMGPLDKEWVVSASIGKGPFFMRARSSAVSRSPRRFDRFAIFGLTRAERCWLELDGSRRSNRGWNPLLDACGGMWCTPTAWHNASKLLKLMLASEDFGWLLGLVTTAARVAGRSTGQRRQRQFSSRGISCS